VNGGDEGVGAGGVALGSGGSGWRSAWTAATKGWFGPGWRSARAPRTLRGRGRTSGANRACSTRALETW